MRPTLLCRIDGVAKKAFVNVCKIIEGAICENRIGVIPGVFLKTSVKYFLQISLDLCHLLLLMLMLLFYYIC